MKALFTPGPALTGASHPKSSPVFVRREIQISRIPKPPARSLLKYIVCPSREKEGVSSLDRVDRRPHVHGRAPGILAAGALRDPDVVSAKAARAVRIEV